MTDNKSGASHELGNLFVDIGSSGIGNLLKGLNSLSATFMLTKNAAQQFTKPIVDMSKNAGRGLVGLEKINTVTGLTIEQLQKLQLWSTANSVDFGNYINQISSFQQNLLDIAMGQGGNIKGFALLGLDPRQMDYTKPIEALEQIKKRVLQLDEATGALALRELGLSSDLLYLWKRQKVQIDEKLLLNKQEQQALEAQNDAWNKLGATWEAATTKLIAKFPIIATWLNKISDKIAKMPSLADKLAENRNKIIEGTENLEISGATDPITGILLIPTLLKNLRDNFYNNHLANSLKDNYDDLTPEQKKKFDEAISKNPVALQQHKLRRIDETIRKINDSMNFSFEELTFMKKPEIINTNTTPNKATKPNGALISSQPLTDIPTNITGDGDILPPVPQAATSQNTITNNITLTQNITGNNAAEIAARARSGISTEFNDFLNTMEREQSHGF